MLSPLRELLVVCSVTVNSPKAGKKNRKSVVMQLENERETQEMYIDRSSAVIIASLSQSSTAGSVVTFHLIEMRMHNGDSTNDGDFFSPKLLIFGCHR